jgi:hypothetical protein
VVRAMRPAHAGFPNRGTENDHGQKEKYTDDFKPNSSADALEGAEESANPAGDASGSLPSHLTGSTALRGTGRSICWLNGRGLSGGARLAGGYALTGNAAGDAKADTNSTTDGLGFHSKYDGNSVTGFRACARSFRQVAASSRLLSGGVGSKV